MNKENELRYQVVPGPLRNIVKDAQAAVDATVADGKDPSSAPLYVLGIDEINRANLSKVLGELFFALEYRDDAVELQYSREPLSIPENLWFIGTMNAANRSIATFDTALRRRVDFVPCDPLQPPLKGILRRYYDAKGRADLYWVADILDAANAAVPDPAYAIGPSYFMRTDLDETVVRRVWEHAVWPYLVGRFDPDVVAGLRWDALRANGIEPSAAPTVDDRLQADLSWPTSVGVEVESESVNGAELQA